MRKLIYKHEPFIELFKVNRKINNKNFINYHNIKLCNGTMVILRKNNKILFIKEYRFAFNKKVYGLPGGIIDKKKNTPLNTIKNELIEETGFVAKKWKSLLSFKRHGTYDCGSDFVFTAEYVYKKQNKSKGDKNNTLHWVSINSLNNFINKNLSLLTPGVIASVYYFLSKIKKI